MLLCDIDYFVAIRDRFNKSFIDSLRLTHETLSSLADKQCGDWEEETGRFLWTVDGRITGKEQLCTPMVAA